MSRKNWPSEAANKIVIPGPQVPVEFDWPLGQRRTRQLAALPQFCAGLIRGAALNLSLLAHSATNMGMSITATGKAIECCLPLTCTSLTGSESSGESDLPPHLSAICCPGKARTSGMGSAEAGWKAGWMHRTGKKQATRGGRVARSEAARWVSGEPCAAKNPQERLAAPCFPAFLETPAPTGHPWNCPVLLVSCMGCVPRVTLKSKVSPTVESPAYTHQGSAETGTHVTPGPL